MSVRRSRSSLIGGTQHLSLTGAQLNPSLSMNYSRTLAFDLCCTVCMHVYVSWCMHTYVTYLYVCVCF